MSDIFKTLKGLFVVQTPTEGETTESTDKTNSAKSDTPANSATSGSTPTTPVGKASEKFYDILLASMEANNQEGFDYLEYKKSLQTLSKMPMDEQTRYFSAFAAAQAMGVTSQKLTDSANFYLKVLAAEDSKFQESVNAQRQKQIGNKEKAIADMDATIKAKAEQITRLTQEIQAHQTDMEKMKAEISDAVVKIETTLSDFHATFNELTAQISKDVENMAKYLK
ncbi:hypothetical protein [Emticicia sp. C21]|uniref:hypothetical protein n=1 Tax=Emticicia sp. C21 TaxID=2302915 RepID=UPI000E34539F|nr:hypothetical protein [Emticicia sp. C21]RFS18537.1 hypothetical protein D0T08_04615 [Emticicia sp. C21]